MSLGRYPLTTSKHSLLSAGLPATCVIQSSTDPAVSAVYHEALKHQAFVSVGWLSSSQRPISPTLDRPVRIPVTGDIFKFLQTEQVFYGSHTMRAVGYSLKSTVRGVSQDQ